MNNIMSKWRLSYLLFYFIIADIESSIILNSECNICAENDIDTKTCITTDSLCQNSKFAKCLKSSTSIYSTQCLKIKEETLSINIRSTRSTDESFAAEIDEVSDLNLPAQVNELHLFSESYIKPRLTITSRFFSSSAAGLRKITMSNLDVKLSSNVYRFSNILRKELKELYMENCEIKKIPSYFDQFEGLETLSLKNNKLGRIDVGLENVKTLYLNDNRFDKFPDGIVQFTNLENLFITGIEFSPIYAIELRTFNFIKKLKKFKMDKSSIYSKFCVQGTKKEWNGYTFCVNIIEDEVKETPSKPSSSDSDDSSTTTIIIIVSIIILLILAVVVFFILRARKRRRVLDKIEESSITCASSSSGPSNSHYLNFQNQRQQNSKTNEYLENLPEINCIRIPYAEITFHSSIACGGFGAVYKASYAGSFVAIKTLLPERMHLQSNNMQAFVKEIELMSRLRHPRIVLLIGVAWSHDTPLCAVTEFMDRGDLRNVLNQQFKMTWKNEKWLISVSIAEALLYLHSHNPPLVHRDLKSRNVIMDSIKGTKISDFGLSRHKTLTQDSSTMTGGVGTIRWMAPEMILGESYNQSVDVYALGIILSELSTLKIPFDGLYTDSGQKLAEGAIMHGIATGQLRPDFGNDSPKGIVELGIRCTSMIPSERPAISEVVECLHGRLRLELQ